VTGRPALGAVLIVKNEVDRIAACLESAIAAGVTVFAITDTGSTDGTTARIMGTLAAHEGVTGAVQYHPFVNFGDARSAAFAYARGEADWLLALDADMTVEVDPGWVPDPDVDAYTVAMLTEGVAYRLPLVLRGDRPWVSIGAAHEYTALEGGVLGRRSATDAVRVHYEHDAGTRSKALFYARLLEDELEAEPDNPRTLYYLAQAYRGLGDPRARDLYGRRAALDDGEEAALAAYWYACLTPDPAARIPALIAAWEKRPSRLEPLYDLVHELNAAGMYLTAYRLASTTVGPCLDELPRWPAVYAWGMDFERSIAAWHVGEFAVAAELDRALLERDLPESVREAVLRNRALLPDGLG